MIRRLENIECWHCEELFDFTVDIPEQHSFSVYCAFCEKENVIDLNPYIQREESAFRQGGGGQAEVQDKRNYELPDPILAQKPEPDDTNKQ